MGSVVRSIWSLMVFLSVMRGLHLAWRRTAEYAGCVGLAADELFGHGGCFWSRKFCPSSAPRSRVVEPAGRSDVLGVRQEHPREHFRVPKETARNHGENS